jgi:DNA-binding CsgD family transcriptional regulator/tetratricopeptide (TPR) repeat protein
VREGFLDREHEVDAITRVLTEGGQGVVVAGAAGIGKTTLLRWATERATASGWRVVRAEGSELERYHGFGVVRQLFERLVTRAPGADREAWFSGSAALAQRVLVGSPGGREAPAEFAVLNALYWFALNVAEDTPLAVVVDDAHVADEPSLRSLAYLARRLAGERIVLLVATRSGPVATRPALAELMLTESMLDLTLGPLSVAGVAALLHAEAKDGDRLAEAVHQATGGNPFLVTSTVRALACAGEGAAPEAIIAAAAGDVATSVVDRLHRCGASATELATALATLGGKQPIGLVATLSSLTLDEAVAAADELRAADLITGTDHLAFRHAIVASAVETAIPPGTRRRAAAVLTETGAEEETVVAQLVREVPAGDETTVERLMGAAGVALARATPETAAALLKRALAEPPPSSSRCGVLAALGRAESAAGSAAATAHLREARSLASDRLERAEIAVDLARAHANRLEHAEAVSALEAALEELGHEDRALDDGVVATLQRHLVINALQDSALALKAIPLVGALADRGGDPRAQEIVGLAGAMAAGFLGGSVDDCLASIRQHPPTMDNDDVDWDVRSLAVYSLISAEDGHAMAERLLAHADDVARRTGYARATLLVCSGSAMLAEQRGDVTGTIVQGELTRRLAEELDIATMRVTSASMLARAQLELDDIAAASAQLAGLEVTGENNIRVVSYYDARARIDLDRGDASAALVTMDSAAEHLGRLLPATVSSPALWSWRAPLVYALRGVGRDEEAAAVATEELDAARRWREPIAIAVALRGAAATSGGDEQIALLEEAVQLLRGRPPRLELGYALHDLGAAHRRGGRRSEARHLLEEALDLGLACGSVRLARRAQAEIRAAGGRPRRPHRSGPEALTPMERRVADLASGGMTNRQIAQDLFVTVKTVEGHLAAVYRKLRITGRAQLAAALERPSREERRSKFQGGTLE